MDKERFVEILRSGNDGDWEGDNAFAGLMVIAKYINPNLTDLICGASHDEIYSVELDDLLAAGITEADAHELRRLNWGVAHNEYLQCFV